MGDGQVGGADAEAVASLGVEVEFGGDFGVFEGLIVAEGGLDVVGQHNALAPFVARLNDAGIRVSLFIAADPAQIEMAAKLRAPVIEIHTGAWCDAVVDGEVGKAEAEWQRIAAGAKLAEAAGLEVHAGHGLETLGGSVSQVTTYFRDRGYRLEYCPQDENRFVPLDPARSADLNDRFFLFATTEPGSSPAPSA